MMQMVLKTSLPKEGLSGVAMEKLGRATSGRKPAWRRKKTRGES